MTNKKAIKRLNNIWIRDALQEDYDALHMAIAALKAEPCGDAVSRETILTLKQTFHDNAGYETEYVDIEDIKALPPVTPKPRWIPASEDLPKESDEYLVSVIDEYDGNYEAVGVARYDVEEGEWQGLGVDRTVIAWMPKPATYKEGVSE